MSVWLSVTQVATVLNLAVLLGLGAVWLDNYRRLRTRFTLGFLAFGTFLLAHNAFAVYLYLLDPTTSGWFAEIPTLYNRAFSILAVLQTMALAVLAWVTLE